MTDQQQPAAPAKKKPPAGKVFVRVTRFGKGRIHTGKSVGDTHPEGSVFACPEESAVSYESRGWVEIEKEDA